MTWSLSPKLAYDTAETALSWAGRLAAVHTGQPMQRLLKDLNIPFSAFLAGDPEVVGKLATLAGEARGRVLRGAFRLLSRYHVFRDESCSKSFVTPRVRRICPLCLREDGEMSEWRHRILWCFPCVGVCPDHGAALVTVPPERDGIDVRDAVDALGGIDQAAAGSEERTVPDYVLWLNQRLADTIGEPDWLSRQTIAQVIEASEMVGSVFEHGHRARVSVLSPELRHRAIDRGFAIVAAGPDAIMAAFDDIRAASTARAVQAGPLGMYGQLFEWLDRRTYLLDPGPIKGLLREHILRHDAIPCGALLLGAEVSERRLHSIATLSEVTGITRRRLTRLLQKLGHMPGEISDFDASHLTFPAVAMEQLCRDLSDAIPMEDVPDYIGASMRLTQALRRVGILTPLVQGQKPGDVRQIVFARRALDGLLDRVSALPVIEDADAVDLSSYCQRQGGFAEDMVAAILNGVIPAHRIDGRGLGCIRLRLDALSWSRQRHGAEPNPCMVPSVANGSCGPSP